MSESTSARRDEAWPTWAKVLLATMVLLTAAVVLPWILMWSGCLSAMGGMDGMRQLMEGGRPMMR